MRERIDQLVTADREVRERIAEGVARAENVRDVAKEAAETAAKAVAQARVAADRADVTVRQVDLPSYAAEGAMGSGKIWKPGSIDPEDVLAALPEGVREPARASIEELFSEAKVVKTLRRLFDEGIRIEVDSRELHLRFERTAATPVHLPRGAGFSEWGIRSADASRTVGREGGPQYGVPAVMPNMLGAATEGVARSWLFNPSVRPSVGTNEQRNLVSTTEFSRGINSRPAERHSVQVPEQNFVVDGRFVIDVRAGEGPPRTYQSDVITDVALVRYYGEDVPPAVINPGPGGPVLPLPASALHEVFVVPQAAAVRGIRGRVLAGLPVSEVGVEVRDSVSRELSEDAVIVKFGEITGGGYRSSPLRLPGAKLNTLSLEVSAELRSVRRVDDRVVPDVNLRQIAGGDTKLDTSVAQSASIEGSASVGPGLATELNEERRGLGAYTMITPFTVSGAAESGETLTQLVGTSGGKKTVASIEGDAVLVEATLDVRVARYSSDPALEGSDTVGEKVFLWMPVEEFARLEEISAVHSALRVAEEHHAPQESPAVPVGLRERQNFRDLVDRVRPEITRELVEAKDGELDAGLENDTAEHLALSVLADYGKRPEITIPVGQRRQPDMLAAGKSTGGGVVDRAPGIERVLPEVRRLLRESVGDELRSLDHDVRSVVETQLSSAFGAPGLFGEFSGELRGASGTIQVGDRLVTIEVTPELGALVGTGGVAKSNVDSTAKNTIRGESKAKAGTKHRIGVESGATIGTKRKDFWRTLGFLVAASAQFSRGYAGTLGQSHKVHRRARFVGPAVTFDRLVTWSISVSTKPAPPKSGQPQPEPESQPGLGSQTGQSRSWYRWLGLFGGRANGSAAANNSDIELNILSSNFFTRDSDSDGVEGSGDASRSSNATTTGRCTSTVSGWTRVLVPEPLAPTTPQGDLSDLGMVVRDFDYGHQDDNPFQVNVEFLMPQGVATPSTVLSEAIGGALRKLAGGKQQDAATAGEDSPDTNFDQLVAPGGLPVAGGRVRLRLFDAHPVGTAAGKLNLEVGTEGGLKLDGQEMRGRGFEGRFRGSAWMLFGGKSSRAYVAPSLTGRGKFSQEEATTYGRGTARRRIGRTTGASHLYRAHGVFEITRYGESDAAETTEKIAVGGGVEFLLSDAVAQRMHTHPAREPAAQGQPPRTRHLELPAGVERKPTPVTEVRYPPEFVLSGAALGPTIVTEISNAHEVAPLIKSMISEHAPGFGTGRWLEVPTGIAGSVEKLASATAVAARFGQEATSGMPLLAARPYLGGTETIEFVVRARYAPDAQATPDKDTKSDTAFLNTEKRAQAVSRSQGGGGNVGVLVARKLGGDTRRAGAHPEVSYDREWSRNQRDTESDTFKSRVLGTDAISYSYTWPTWFQVEMYRTWTPNAVLNNLLLTAPRRGIEMWSEMQEDTRTPQQRWFTSDGTARYTIPGGLTTTTPPVPRPVRIGGRLLPQGGDQKLGPLPRDLRGVDVIPLALPGSERLFPWLAAVLAHPAPPPADDADPASAELSLRAPAGNGWIRPATLPAQLLWQLGGEEGLTAMMPDLFEDPVLMPAMVETGMVWDDEHGLAVRLRFAEVDYVNSFTATGELTQEQKTEHELTQSDTGKSSAALPGLATIDGGGPGANNDKYGKLSGDMLLPGETSTLDPSGGISGNWSNPRVQVSTRGTTREVTTEKKGTYHVYRAGKAIYTLTDRTAHRFLFSALPGNRSEIEVTIDNGGYFAVESTQAAAKNLPGPPPQPLAPATAPEAAPATLPAVWTPHADDHHAAGLLPKIRGHLVIGLTASGGTLTVPELAARIEQLPGWAKRPIVLIGSDGSLDLADAAQLRDTLGVDVITADHEVWHAADGRVVTGDLSFVRGGLPTWSERAEAILSGEGRSATAGHWHLLSATGGTRQLPGADLLAALAGTGTTAQAGTAPGSDCRWGARSAPVSLPVHGATDTAEYTGWTRSPHHATAAPEGRKPLLVLGHDDTVTPNTDVTTLRSTGADVLARVNRGRGPKWMLHRADGSRPRPVDPPTDMTHTPRPKPLLFGGPEDSAETIQQATDSAPDLPGTQIVGAHVTPDGQAILPDGRHVTPETLADEVRQHQHFVPGLPIALLGCAAHQRPEPGKLTFAERLARALHTRVWTTRADVVQTKDRLVHATKVKIAQDGTLLPTFVDGLGTGHWYLLGSQGQQLWRSGPELRAAVALNGSAPPRYADEAPPAVIRWTGRKGKRRRQTAAHRGAVVGGVVASGQQDAEAGKAKRVRRPGIDKERLYEWVVRAQKVGGARTAAAGLKWVNGQGFEVHKNVWGDAWLAATGKAKQVRWAGEDKERLKEWVVRAQEEGGARTAAAGLKWVNGQGLVVHKNVWGDAWLAATGKAKQVRRPGIDKERLKEWVVRAQEEGEAETAAAGLEWVNGQGFGVRAENWWDAWLAETGKEKRVQRPGIDKERLKEWVVRAQEEGGAETAAAGLEWVNGQGFGVEKHVWGDAWLVEAGKEKRVRRPGIEREQLDEWVVLSQKVGGAETAAAGLEWVNGQGFGVEKNVWGEAWLGLEVLDHWSADFQHEDDPFAWEGFDGVGERDVAGDLDLLLVGDEASERGSGEVYPGESQAGPSTVQTAAHQGSAYGGVAAFEQQDADAGKVKRIRRPRVDKERLKEWVVRAQEEGGARTAAVGRKWARGQGFEVGKNVWGDAWLAATGKAKRVRRPGIDKERLYEWVVRAQKVGGAETAAAGLEWVNGQGLGVKKTVWAKAWRDRGVLDHRSADFEDGDDLFGWEGVDGVGETDVAGDLDFLPVDLASFAESGQAGHDFSPAAHDLHDTLDRAHKDPPSAPAPIRPQDDTRQVAGADDFAGFLPDYHGWKGSVGLFGVEGPDGASLGEPFQEVAVGPDGVWPGAVGSEYRFVPRGESGQLFF